MLKVSLIFFLIGCVSLLFADIEVISQNSLSLIVEFFYSFLSPDFSYLTTISHALINTLAFAFLGILFGITFGSVMSLFFGYKPVRYFCSFLRSIHEIFWALIFLPAFGLSPITGILAIGVPYSGIFAKVYHEIYQESDHRPLDGLPKCANGLSKLFYGVMPLILHDLKNYSSYRLECALRSSAILGFIGLPTLGYFLETAFTESFFAKAAALLLFFYLIIGTLKWWAKPKLMPFFMLFSFLYLSLGNKFGFNNFIQFITYDIMPWPMRRQGVIDGTYVLDFDINAVFNWLIEILKTDGLTGIINTLIVTQVALVLTAIVTLLLFPTISKYFINSKYMRFIYHVLLVIQRTTPEYILAFILIIFLGPSMLPAFIAIALHNGAIIAFLIGKSANAIVLPPDTSKNRFNRYFYEILPRVYGQFLAYLFYRWEIILRESAILGILGIFTIGFYINSAISDDKLDRVIVLILITSILNQIIDSISQQIRKNLKVSTKQLAI